MLVGLIPAALVDVIDRRLPNRLVGGAAALGLLAVGIEALATDLEVAPADLLLGATLMAGLPFAIHMAVPAAMGFGDVKVALLTGAALGLADWLLGLAALAIGSAGAALIAIARRRRTVPFGPGLVGGAIVALALLASPLDPIGRTGDEPSGSPLTTVREVRA